jgi:hypothetical protein
MPSSSILTRYQSVQWVGIEKTKSGTDMQFLAIVPAQNIFSSKLHTHRSYLPMPKSPSFPLYFRVHGESVLFGGLVRYVESERNNFLREVSSFPANNQLALGKLREKLCDIAPESREHLLLFVNVTTGTCSLIMVALRFLSRYLVCKRLWLDDGVILSAMVSDHPHPYRRLAHTISSFSILLSLWLLAGVWIFPNLCILLKIKTNPPLSATERPWETYLGCFNHENS